MRSPLCAGSPGTVQPQSPYRHALQHSPPDNAGSVRQMTPSPRQTAVQNQTTVYSPYTGVPKAVHNTPGHSVGKIHDI